MVELIWDMNKVYKTGGNCVVIVVVALDKYKIVVTPLN